jgi:hypothetical protein
LTSKQTQRPATAADPVELARADVDRLNQQERELSKLYRVKAAELSAARAKRGDDVLAAHDPASAARDSSRQVAVMVEELAALADAAAAARRQRMSAIPAVFNAEADEGEREAAQRDADAAANRATVDEALKEVRKRADCDYVPASELAFARRGELGGGAGNLSVMTVRVPIFARLQNEANALRLEAAQRRVKEPQRAGSVEAASLEQLIELVHADAMRIGPSISAIARWFDDAVTNERRRRQRIDHGDDFVPVDAAITHLQLTWKNGAIDVSASDVSSPSPSEAGVHVVDLDAEYARAVASEHSA